MFFYEIDKAMELLDTYKNTMVKEDLYFDEWMDGEYQHLVPKILAQVIASSRFMEYMYHAIHNDSYPNSIRMVGEKALYDESGCYDKLWRDNNRIFDEITSAIAFHLIDQSRDISFSRNDLRKGLWTEENYYELRTLRLVMDTMCLLCDKVLEPFYEYFATVDNWRNREDFTWVNDGMDSSKVNEDIEFALADLSNEDLNLFKWEETEDLFPPLWVHKRQM